MNNCQSCHELQTLKAENERLKNEQDLLFLLVDLIGVAVESLLRKNNLADSKEQLDQSGSQRANQIRMLADQIGETGKEVTGNRILTLFKLFEDITGCHPDPKGDPGDVGTNKEVVNTPESPVLDEQDIYCIARLIQGAWFQQDIFFGCANFCKYGMPCIGKGIYPNRMDQLLEKLGRLSGLNLSKSCSSFDPVERFSYDANDESSKDRPEPIYRL